MAYFCDANSTSTQIARARLQAMGQFAAEPDVTGNPTITDTI